MAPGRGNVDLMPIHSSAMTIRIALSVAVCAAIGALLCSAERPEDVDPLSLFQSNLEFLPRSSLAEQGDDSAGLGEEFAAELAQEIAAIRKEHQLSRLSEMVAAARDSQVAEA